MKMMQRYILMDLLRVFGLLVAVLTAMLVFVGVTQQASENNLGGARILQIMPFVVPQSVSVMTRSCATSTRRRVR